MTEAWAYYNANTIEIIGDVSAYYWPNQLVSITQTMQKFFVVMGVAVIGGNTHLTVSGGGIYALANAPITAHAVTANAGISGLPSGFIEQGLAYGAASKDTPADGDRISLWDSAANFVQKGLTWAKLKSTLKAYFDPIYAAGDHTHSAYVAHSLATAANDFLVASGSGAFVKKTLAEVKTILGLGTAAYTASTIYALLAGRSGGQTINGGTGASEALVFHATSHATAGKIYFGGAAVFDEANTRLGIGTTSPAVSIHTNGQIRSNSFQCHDGTSGTNYGNAFNIYWTGSSAQLWIDVTSFTLSLSSDARVKKNVATILSALDKICLVNPISFEWKNEADGVGAKYGFTAQELALIYPELVRNTGMITADAPDGLLQVDYVGFIAPIVRAIQELSSELAESKNEIADLTARLEKLEGKVATT